MSFYVIRRPISLSDLRKPADYVCWLPTREEAEAWIDEQNEPGNYYIHETHEKVGGRVSGLAS